MTISDNIKKLREQNGYTQESMAVKMECKSSFVSALERGGRNPGKKTMKKLCDVFGVTEQEIRYGKVSVDRKNVLQALINEITDMSETEQYEWIVKIRKWREGGKP